MKGFIWQHNLNNQMHRGQKDGREDVRQKENHAKIPESRKE